MKLYAPLFLSSVSVDGFTITPESDGSVEVSQRVAEILISHGFSLDKPAPVTKKDMKVEQKQAEEKAAAIDEAVKAQAVAVDLEGRGDAEALKAAQENAAEKISFAMSK